MVFVWLWLELFWVIYFIFVLFIEGLLGRGFGLWGRVFLVEEFVFLVFFVLKVDEKLLDVLVLIELVVIEWLVFMVLELWCKCFEVFLWVCCIVKDICILMG